MGRWNPLPSAPSERYQIQALKELEYSARKIGQKIRRSNKTISRELQRCPAQPYCAETAHQGACLRRQQAEKAHKKSAEVIRQTKFLLDLKMSPEQIAGRMKLESPHASVSRQTIYRIVRQAQWRDLLPRRGKRYRPRKDIEAGARLIPNRN